MLVNRNKATTIMTISRGKILGSKDAIAVASKTPNPPGAPGTTKPSNQAKLKAVKICGIKPIFNSIKGSINTIKAVPLINKNNASPIRGNKGYFFSLIVVSILPLLFANCCKIGLIIWGLIRVKITQIPINNKLNEINPCLILMDIQMPEMDGFEAIKLIKNNPKWQKIPIVALTALAMRGDKEKCIEIGADDYLSKPFRLRDLIEKIKALLP